MLTTYYREQSTQPNMGWVGNRGRHEVLDSQAPKQRQRALAAQDHSAAEGGCEADSCATAEHKQDCKCKRRSRFLTGNQHSHDVPHFSRPQRRTSKDHAGCNCDGRDSISVSSPGQVWIMDSITQETAGVPAKKRKMRLSTRFGLLRDRV